MTIKLNHQVFIQYFMFANKDVKLFGLILYIIYRFPRSKLRRLKLYSNVLRCKMHSAVLEAEKITDMESIQVESTSVAWLHKVAPAFPVDGSKVLHTLHL